MNRLLADTRLALRTWRKTPGFTAVAVISIALGIGANTAIFTLVDQVLLRGLPVREPHELVQVTFQGSRYGSNWGDGSELSYPVYTELRDHNDVFAGMFGRFGYSFHIGHAGRTERIPISRGRRPRRGNGTRGTHCACFLPREADPGCARP